MIPFGFMKRNATATFDPATLSLTGWWRADSTTGYVAGTFDGVASAGGSGSRDLTQGTGANQPGTGVAIDGHTAPDFDGTNDFLTNATAISTMLSASAWRMWALIQTDAIATNDATSYNNDTVICDTGLFWGVFLRNNAGTQSVYAYQWDGAEKAVSITASITGNYTLIQARYDGSNVRLKVNGSSVSTVAAGNISTTTGTIVCGAGSGIGARPYNGRIIDCGLLAAAGADADFENIRNYCIARYPSAGGI
jgi:hypothetical protein